MCGTKICLLPYRNVNSTVSEKKFLTINKCVKTSEYNKDVGLHPVHSEQKLKI